MNRADLASGLFWGAVGAYVCHAGWELELGSLHDPGSGFMLFWTGLVMVGLSLGILVNALRRGAAARGPRLEFGGRWPKVILAVVALVAYAWALPRLGFIVTTFVVLLVLFKGVEPQRWSVAIAGAVASALVAYLVFQVWLGAQLPAGVLGIG